MSTLPKRFIAETRFKWRLPMLVALLPLFSACIVETPAPPQVHASIRISEAPPPLPVYEQPPCPEDGYLWTPGYWSYGGGEYYWVPGTWVRPPRVGVLWTPGYWGWSEGVYVFHGGYWGAHVGFYGGVAYGGGYTGNGYAGGRWEHNHVTYNTAVTNVNQTIIHNTYNEHVTNVTVVNNISYNGGTGTHATPTAQEQQAQHEPHVQPTPQQLQHVSDAQQNPLLHAKVNQGHPTIAATPKPSAFNAPGVMPARASSPARAPAAPSANHEIMEAKPQPASSRPVQNEAANSSAAPPQPAHADIKQQPEAPEPAAHPPASHKPPQDRANKPSEKQKRPAKPANEKPKNKDKEHDRKQDDAGR